MCLTVSLAVFVCVLHDIPQIVFDNVHDNVLAWLLTLSLIMPQMVSFAHVPDSVIDSVLDWVPENVRDNVPNSIPDSILDNVPNHVCVLDSVLASIPGQVMYFRVMLAG